MDRMGLKADVTWQRPNQRMNLSARGGRLKGKCSVLIAAAGRSLCAMR